MPNSGDRVSVKTKSQVFEGVYLPSSQNAEFVKLDSGYNIGVAKDKIVSMSVLASKKAVEPVKLSVKVNPSLPTISIIHTGGTIASKVDYDTGAVSSLYSPEELLAQFPELGAVVNIRVNLVSKIFSEDIRFSHYNRIVDAVVEEVAKGCEGVIITHGTDTLHYSSAALYFMLRDCPVPVVLVGAQRSSDRPSADSAMNVFCAVKLITSSDFGGVGICMHESMSDDFCVLLPALNSRKMHSSRRDAFKSVNCGPVARIPYGNGNVVFLSEYVRKDKSRKLKTSTVRDSLRVGLLKSHPNMFAEELLAFEGFDGLILEGTGLGHFPINKTDSSTLENEKIFQALQSLISNGVKVVMATQTIYGSTDLNVYSTGRKLKSIGVVESGFLTAESAFIKLAWVLSNCPDKFGEVFNG